MKKYLSYLILIIIFISGCKIKKTTESDDQISSEILPLAVDNTWNYELNTVAYSCNEGELECIPYFISDAIEHEITEKMDIEFDGDSIEVFVLVNYFDAIPPTAYRTTNEGLVEYGEVEAERDIDFDVKLKVKYPIEAGETWIDKEGFYGTEYKCISTTESMNTPAGTFNCYVFELVDENFLEDEYVRYYYTLDIGLIAEIHHRETFYYNNIYYDIPVEYQNHYVKKITSYSLN